MFNFKEKLNQFLDDIEGEEAASKEKITPNNPNDEASFRAKQQELASYLNTMNADISDITPQISKDEPISIARPQVDVSFKTEPALNVSISTHSDDVVIGQSVKSSTNTNVFAHDLVITGDVITEDAIQSEGVIKGNIDCKNRVLIKGNVEGDIKALSLACDNGSVKGNISVEENVLIAGDSTVKGDIYNDSISIDGVVNGCIHARGRVKINPNAEIYGDVSAKAISMEEGSVVQGNIRISNK